jgi:predicted RND superfamily exporter protein
MFPGFAKLSAEFTHKGFFHDDDPLLLRFEAFERQFGNDDALVIAVHSPSGVFDVDSAKLLTELTEETWLINEVIRVESLANYQWVHAEGDDILVEPFFPDEGPVTQELLTARKAIALKHETLPDYLVSKDAKTAMIFASIKPGIKAPPNAEEIVLMTREMLKKFHRGDHQFYVTGNPAVTYAFKEATQTDMQTIIPRVFLMTILLLLALLRKISGVFVALLVVLLSIMGAMGLSGHLGIQITNLTSVLPQILIAIGIADAVHILVTFYRAMLHGKVRKDAAYYSLTKNFLPTLLTSLTTAVGFFSFATADLKPMSGLGILAGSGALLAWLVTYLVLGSLMFLLPIKAKVRPEASIDRQRKLVVNFTSKLHGFRVPIVVGYTVLVALCIYAGTKNTVNSDPFKYFTPEFPIRIANEFVEANVGGARGIDLVVDAGKEEGIKDPEFLAKVEKFQSWIDDQPRVTRSVSVVDILKHMNRALHGGKQEEFKLPTERDKISQELFLYTMSLPQGMDINDRVTLKNDALRITVLWTLQTSNEVVKAIDTISKQGEVMGLNVKATGKNMLYQSMNGYVVKSFLVSITAAVIIISMLLVMFLGSFKIGMLAMIPNAIPLLIGGAILWLLGQPLDIGTVLVASVCLGIAVDDTIHVLANYNRYRSHGMGPRESIEEVLHHTAPALITTSLILVMAFGTFAFATFVPNLYFGVLTALILAVALITDLTFLPALLMVRDEDSSKKVESSVAASDGA